MTEKHEKENYRNKTFDLRSVLEAVCAPLRENENGSKQNTNSKHLNLRISSFVKAQGYKSGFHKCTVAEKC